MSENRCPYCGDLMPNPRRKQCGKPECKRQYNAQRCREWQARYTKEHGVAYPRQRYPEKRAAWRRQWREANSEQRREDRRALKRRRRAAKLSNNHEHFLDVEIFERDNWVCGICGEPVPREAKYPDPMSASLDHIIPVSKGGSHTRDNVRCSHLACNCQRGAKQAA